MATDRQTTLYLVRHAATAANLAHPAKLQGRGTDPPLTPFGVRQAEATRDLLAGVPLVACYSSPLRRARETAALVAAPHGLEPQPLAALTECDVGVWEGLSWEEVADRYPAECAAYRAEPGTVPYLGGESFAAVHERAAPAFAPLWDRHAGQAFAIVSHHVVCRVLLAVWLGLPVRGGRNFSLDNGGVSVVHRIGNTIRVATLNAALHMPTHGESS